MIFFSNAKTLFFGLTVPVSLQLKVRFCLGWTTHLIAKSAFKKPHALAKNGLKALILLAPMHVLGYMPLLP